jgi:hypothetical protein
MKGTTPVAMPPCFERWCKRFDELFKTKAQKRELGIIWGDYWVKVKEKTYFRWLLMQLG